MNALQSQPARQYRPDIDGLRAVAILSVVLYHAHVPFVTGGFTGVDIFFVISGYLIGGHIFSDLSAGTFSYLQFYRLRAKRILPAFFGMLAATILAALLLFSPYEARDFSRSALTATLSVSNIYFWRYVNYFQGPAEFNPLLMTWSLGVEEQFYAVIPLLLVVLARIRRSLILPAILVICALSLLLAWHEFPIQPFFVFFMLPARAWELGVGVALAIAELTTKRALVPASLANLFSIAGVAMMLAPVFLIKTDSQFPGTIALPTVLGTALVIAFPVSWISRRLLSLSPLVFIGRISYSWYLWHWPVLAFLRVISQRDLSPAVAATAVLFSLALAIASFFFIEQPFRKSSRAPAPLLLRYALLSVPFLAASVLLWKTEGLPQRYPDLLQLSNEKRAYETDPCLATISIDKADFAAPCYPVSGNRPIVALWGDSHGAALAPTIRAKANSAGYDFAQLTRAACRPEGDDALQDPGCSQFNRQVIDRFRQDPRIRIVIIADAWGHMNLQPSETVPPQSVPSNPRPGGTTDAEKNKPMQFLQASIRSLQSSGKQVIVFGDVPSFDTDPYAQFWTSRIPLRRTIATWIGVPKYGDASSPSEDSASNDAQAAALLHDTLASLPGVTYVDLRHSLCNQSGSCAYSKDGHMLYFDYQHLTPDGARYVLKDFHLTPSTQ